MSVDISMYLPDHWARDARTAAIMATIDTQLETLALDRDRVLDEINPTTAEELLPLWEDANGIQRAGVADLAQRRAQLVARLRGQGVTTVQMIRSLAKTLLGCDAVVVEHPADYAIDVRLSESREDDADVDRFRAALAEIIPSHLAVRVVADYLAIEVQTFWCESYYSSTQVYNAEGVLIECDQAESSAWSTIEPRKGAIARIYVDRTNAETAECVVKVVPPLNLRYYGSLEINVPFDGPSKRSIQFTGERKSGPWEFAPGHSDTSNVQGTVYLAALEGSSSGDLGEGTVGEVWGIGAGGGTDGDNYTVWDGGSTTAYWSTCAYAGGGSGEMMPVVAFGLRTRITFSVGPGGNKGQDGGDTTVTITRPDGTTESYVAKGGKAAEIAFHAGGNSADRHSQNGIVANGGPGGTGGGAAGAASFNWCSAGAAGVDGSDGGDTTVGSTNPCSGKQGLGGKGKNPGSESPYMVPFSGSPRTPVMTWAKEGKSCGNGGPGVAYTGVDPDAYSGATAGNASKNPQRGTLTPSELLYGDGGYAVLDDSADIPSVSLVKGRPGWLVIRIARDADSASQ